VPPDRALAQCSGLNQTISTPTTGPVLSNGGAITITGSGSILGLPSADGVDALTCPITTLTNESRGTINVGTGFGALVGGAGVLNASTITTLTNSGAISGGKGSYSSGHASQAAQACRTSWSLSRVRARSGSLKAPINWGDDSSSVKFRHHDSF